MKRLVCSEVGKVAWQEVDLKPLAEGEIRVRCEYGVEKHGTMMAFYKGYANERGRWDAEHLIHRPEGVLWNYPIPLGNMQCGVVAESNSDLAVGQRVFFGGPFQPEAVLHESQARLIDNHVSWQSGMMLDPAEFALGAIRDGNVRAGDDVAIFGMGAIGLVAIQVARAAGCHRVIAIDPLPNRREAAAACGADHVLDARDGDVGLRLRELTGMRGPDVVIDFSGSRPALQSALRGVAYLGTIVCGAFPAPFDAGLDFGGEAHMNRPKIVFSRACSDPNPDHPRWDWKRIQDMTAVMIDRRQIRGESIVGPIVSFEDLLTEYPKIASDPANNIKLAVKY